MSEDDTFLPQMKHGSIYWAHHKGSRKVKEWFRAGQKAVSMQILKESERKLMLTPAMNTCKGQIHYWLSEGKKKEEIMLSDILNFSGNHMNVWKIGSTVIRWQYKVSLPYSNYGLDPDQQDGRNLSIRQCKVHIISIASISQRESYAAELLLLCKEIFNNKITYR